MLGTKQAKRVVVAQLAGGLGEQVDGGVPAAGHQDEVAVDLGRGADDGFARAVDRHDIHAGHPLGAVGRGDGRVGQDADAALLGLRRQRAAELGAQIDDGGDGDAGIGHVECRLIGAVVVGQDDGALARQRAEAVDIGAGGVRQHDAGAVVVGEHQGAFVGAGRQNHLFGADLPQALTRDLGR